MGKKNAINPPYRVIPKKHKVEFILNPLLTSDKSEINEKWNSK